MLLAFEDALEHIGSLCGVIGRSVRGRSRKHRRYIAVDAALLQPASASAAPSA